MVEASFAAPHEHRLFEEMMRAITGFDLDDEGHWRAKLECSHYQHVRHDPPLQTREWVMTVSGRQSRVGLELDCWKCDDDRPRDFDK